MIGLDIVLGLGSKLIDNLFPDPVQKAQAQVKLLELQQSGELAKLQSDTTLIGKQLDINLEEAKSTDRWKSGWRPGFGWVGVGAFFCKYLGGPAIFVIAQFFHKEITLPTIDITEMMPVLGGILGLGALRTYEKVKDAS